MTLLLEVTGLTKRYLGLTAVDRVAFEVEAGTVVGLIGPNGSGKSTIVDCLSGFQPADGGQWRLDGRALTGLPAHRIARAGPSKSAPGLETSKLPEASSNWMPPSAFR